MIEAFAIAVLSIFLLPWYWLAFMLGCLWLFIWIGGDPKNEGRIFATVPLLFVGIVILAWNNKLGAVLNWIWANPGTISLYTGMWLLIGVLWSGKFWYDIQSDGAQEYLKERRQGKSVNKEIFTPYFKDYKAALIAHVVYWPFSMLYYILVDWVHEVVVWLVNRFWWYYDAVKRLAWRGVE